MPRIIDEEEVTSLDGTYYLAAFSQTGSKRILPGNLPFTQSGTGAVARTVSDDLLDHVSVFRFMTAAQRAGVRSGAVGAPDVTAACQAAIDYSKTFSATQTEVGLVWPAGAYNVTSLNFTNANRLNNIALGAVIFFGNQVGGTAIINIGYGGSNGSGAPTANLNFTGNFSAQQAAGSYAYSVYAYYLNMSKWSYFAVSGSFTTAAFDISFSIDNEIWIQATNTNPGTIHALKCSDGNVNENKFFIRGSCDGNLAHNGTVMKVAGFANTVSGDFNNAQFGLDITAAIGTTVISPYFEVVKTPVIAGVGSGTAIGTVFIGGEYEVGPNGAAFDIGQTGGTNNTTIINPRIKAATSGTTTTAFALGTAAYGLNVINPNIQESGAGIIDTVYSGTWHGAASGLTKTFDVKTAQWLSFPPTQVPSSDANTIDDYQEIPETPTPINLTVVLGGGAVSYSGSVTKVGRLVTYEIVITPSGGATTASTAGSTYFSSVGPAPVTGFVGVCGATDGAGINHGTCLTAETGGSFRVYPPTWVASPNQQVISGFYRSPT